MILDGPWMAVLVAILPAALGHLCHLILTVNVVSGLGQREAVLDRARIALFTAFWLSAAVLLWAHLRSPWWTWPWPIAAYPAACTISGLLIWPVSTLAIAIRRHPVGISSHRPDVELDLAEPGGANELIGEGHGAWMLRLPGNESFRLRLREWEAAIPGLPPALEGLRILQLTDLHMARCFRPAFFERVVAACRALPADLVVLTGDIIEDDEVHGWIRPILSPLEARLGKYAILGNHDEEHRPDEILAELAGAGFETMHGTWTTLDVDGVRIALGGTSAPWGPDVDPSAMPSADFRILLSHSPDRFYRASRWGIELMLSGHNHGGQIRLPIVGAVFMPSIYSRRFDRGFFRRGQTLMYASDGIAGMHPVRYGCPPEVARIILRSANVEGTTAHSRRRVVRSRV